MAKIIAIDVGVPGPQGPQGFNGSQGPGGSGVTTFTSDGAIVTTGDMPITTTFGANGSITAVYGPPVSKTVVTTFGANGAITETVS